MLDAYCYQAGMRPAPRSWYDHAVTKEYSQWTASFIGVQNYPLVQTGGREVAAEQDWAPLQHMTASEEHVRSVEVNLLAHCLCMIYYSSFEYNHQITFSLSTSSDAIYGNHTHNTPTAPHCAPATNPLDVTLHVICVLARTLEPESFQVLSLDTVENDVATPLPANAVDSVGPWLDDVLDLDASQSRRVIALTSSPASARASTGRS